MINNRQIRVSPNKDHQWRVHKAWSTRDIKCFNNKMLATKFAKDIAQRQQGETKIQDRKGRICWGNSYGNDPCPPRDKK